MLLDIAKHNIFITYYHNNAAEGKEGRFIRKVKLDCTNEQLGRFRSSEDSNYLDVRATITQYINFIATRRLWDAISSPEDLQGIEEAKTQILKGADISRKNLQGQNALHLAIGANSLEKVKLLLESDANVNAEDDERQSPIMKAIGANNFGIVLALLERGAQDKETSQVKQSPRVNEEIKKLLDTVTYFAGPSTQHDTRKLFSKSYYDSTPDDCRYATSLFNATVTTFELRCDKNPGSSGSENETEYHTSRTIPVSELLYGKEGDNLIKDELGQKKWRWYHLPVNNVSHDNQRTDSVY